MSKQNTILLQPNDVLFFRDGRPMEGALAGHGAAWPLPSVINAAFHAALHRASIPKAHSHRTVRSGETLENREQLFGSLVTAGPFPVGTSPNGPIWFMPRPRDLESNTLVPSLSPACSDWSQQGNLPKPLTLAVASLRPPSKESGARQWISTRHYEAYLKGERENVTEAVNDTDIFDAEHNIGIAIDPETETTGQGDAAGKIYSAHYLRLRDAFRLGVLGAAWDKVDGEGDTKRDLLTALLQDTHQILVGGQQRACTAELVNPDARLPMPMGMGPEFSITKGCLVKWVLLTPAIWPAIMAGTSQKGVTIKAHPGGWLPNWICASTGDVMLKSRTGKIVRSGRERTFGTELPICARLVSALVSKPLPVTGWSLTGGVKPSGGASKAGAKSTHLAVPAGAVYYFNAASPEDAVKLATALNWHGSGDGSEIKNRRSTLMGEKGFGLGVCGRWSLHETAQ